ncbi:HlyD family efflux transporter periplasmic adaptor subunit [bacterium 0.1xD8-71]|nr:HlyD family efflux transporter periplasmic adaptor subunit [bacterium 0.1xD8-71]
MSQISENKTEEAKVTDVVNDTKENKKEKKAKKEKKPMDKAKKKKIRRRIAVLVIVVLVAGFFVRNSIMAKNTLPTVFTMEVTIEDVEQTLRTNGTVKSMETKSYFAAVMVPVSEVKVAVGDKVKKGDVLLKFDEAALSEARQEAELKLASSQGDYSSSLYKNNKYLADLSEANTNLPVLEQQISDHETYLKGLQKTIEDKKAWYANQGALLQVSLLEWEKTISDEKKALEERNAYEAESQDMDDKEKREKRERDDAAKNQIAQDEETLLSLQEQVQYNSYEQQNNQEIRDLEREAAEIEKIIADAKELKAKMESQKEASEDAMMDTGSKEKLEADTALQKLTNGGTLESIQEVESGITADFAGVVTEINAVEGATPAENGKLVVLESTDKVVIHANVSKYDLEKLAVGQSAEIDIAGNMYEGKVDKIEGMATTNNNGAAVVGVDIGIEKPDENIFLGVEAKVVVHTAKAEGVTTIPMELVNSDRDGDFVYVEENGLVAKRRITVGISNESLCEVKEGLSVGDKVIMSMGQEFEEGMAVTAVPQG